MAEMRSYLEEPNHVILEGAISGDKWAPLQTTDTISKEFEAICSLSCSPRAHLVLRAVTSIGDDFLRDRLSLATLEMPALTGVTRIGDRFLSGCRLLTTIDMSGLPTHTGVTRIGDDFLRACSSLTTIDLSGLTVATSIGRNFLLGCSSLTAIDLSGHTRVTSIGDKFVDKCLSLIAINMSPAMTSLPQTSHLNRLTLSTLHGIDLTRHPPTGDEWVDIDNI